MGSDGARHGGMVVVGGGECGTHAAFALRQRGWSGPITVIGSEPLHAYERPPLSKAGLVEDDSDPRHPYSREAFEDHEITLLTSRSVTSIDRSGHAVDCDGDRIAYDRCLLTVGAQARRLPLPDDVGLLYLRSHEDALRIREHLRPGSRIGVIGAGFIGLEVAAAARSRDCEVVVLEGLGRPLARAVPERVAAGVQELHESHGVQFGFATAVSGAHRAGTQIDLTLTTGGHEIFDAVIVGIGAAPNTELAHASGLAIDNGIAVDEFLRTSDADIFAAGDCAAFTHPLFGATRVRLEAWRNALDQAKTVAGNLLDAGQPHEAVPWFWSDQYDHTLQVSGLSTLAAQYVVRPRADGVELYFGLDDDGRLVCASGLGPGNAVARDIRLAEIMIHDQVSPPPSDLANADLALKKLLRSGAPLV